MRALAFAILTWAAFDLPTWALDRAGLTLLGLAVIALTVGRYQPKPRRLPALRPKPPALLDRNGRIDESRLERVAEYLASITPTGAAPASENTEEKAEKIG